MKKKVILLLSMAAVLSLAAAGCSRNGLSGSETVATLDDTNIPVGEFNLMLRYEQAQMETYYGSMMGGNVYQQDMTGTGTLYGETARDNMVDRFERLYILEAEAPNYGVELTEEEKTAAAEAARKFMEDNSARVREAVTADQATVEHLLTLMALENKMYDVLTADVDTQVSDDEAAQKRVSYLFTSTSGTEFDDEGNVIELTDAEKAEKKAELQEILDEAKEKGDLNEAAEARDMTASTATYGAGTSSLAEEVRAAADLLEDGEFAEIVETDTGYYAVQMVSTFDREATDDRKDTIVRQRRDDLYEEKYAELQEAHTFTSFEDVLKKITFDRVFTLKTEQ